MATFSIKSLLIRGVAVVALTGLMAGCDRSPSSSSSSYGGGSKHACSNNPYLMKYNCSISRVQIAAENGSADAQYALGYMYYYGIGTVVDRQTAELWIQRAAAQGQPLAKKAWSLINSGATFNDFHQAVTGGVSEQQANTIIQQEPDDVDQLNSSKPTKPISNYLPGYRQQHSSQASQLTSGTEDELSSQPPLANQENDAKPPIASNKKTILDPRLQPNSRPVVASHNQPIDFSMQQQPQAQPQASADTSISTTTTSQTQPASSQNQFTIQLIASDKLSDVKDYMNAHQLGSQAAYFETKLNGQPWYMLTYGRYSTENAARMALQQMPSNLKHHQPWIKSMAIVQQEVSEQKVLG